ncbi:MAG: hypothetical protein ACOX88_08580 [Christensenellales bacterium]|jgi:hypothetical protein
MKLDIRRSMIETIVNKTLKDIERDPDRSIRNLVDMGENFSTGRFQKYLFEIAQAMLEDKNSGYYTVVKNAVAHISHDRLRTFGVNMGYNSFTVGAATIRKNEENYGFNFPWTLMFRFEEGGLLVSQIDDVIAQAKKLGLHTFFFTCTAGHLAPLQTLFKAHPDCAFILRIDGPVKDLYLDGFLPFNHLLVSLDAQQEDCFEQAAHLKDKKMLYGVHRLYGAQDIQDILSGKWLEHMSRSAGVFAIFVAKDDCPQHAREQVKAYVRQLRIRLTHPIVTMDIPSDILAIDEVISRQPCMLSIAPDGKINDTATYLLDAALFDTLKKAMPSVTYI